MNTGENRPSSLRKGLVVLLLLVVSALILAAAGAQEKKEKATKNAPAAKSGGQQGTKVPVQQGNKAQGQQPKPQPQYQQARPQPQNQQQPKAQPQYQQPRTQPQYQQPRTQPQYQQTRPQPQYQQQRNQPPYQQQGQRNQAQQPARTLAPAESQQHIQNLNRNRGSMPGINRHPLPQGQVAVRGDGSRVITASGGRQYQVRPNGTVASVSLSGGRTATYRPNGGVRSVHVGGMEINHGLRGDRRVVTERADRSRVVSMGPHRGYVERPYLARGGRTYVQRTYVVNQVTYTRVYRTSYFRGAPYYHYVPPFYFHAGFYGWAYNPWRAAVYYRWPWYAAPPPWYLFWGPYFAPAPFYPSAAFWLTDYLMADSLRAAYEAGREDAANAAAVPDQPPPESYQPPPAAQQQGYGTQVTPEMKAAIAEEVRQQLAAEQQGAAAPPQAAPSSAEAPPPALDPAQRLFVVSGSLAATGVDGQDCELTAGDIVNRLDDVPDSNGQVRVSVSNSKGNDCHAGATLLLAVSDLQDMHNHVQEQMDAGLKTLADNSGKAGLPAAPDTGTSPGEVPAPPPDPNVLSAMAAQQDAANQAEGQVQQEVAQGGQ